MIIYEKQCKGFAGHDDADDYEYADYKNAADYDDDNDDDD